MNRIVQEPGFEYMDLADFEEALADKPAHEKWELIGGRLVRMMVGARWEHNVLVQNVSAGIRDRLRAKGSPCRTLTETFYVKDEAIDAAVLPDVLVYCGPLAPGATSVASPVVVVEVLSVGSEGRDRLTKWQTYQKIESLQHYVLVTQGRPHVETFDRVAGAWTGMKVLDGLDQTLSLPALDVELPLAEIYRDVIAA